MDIFNRGVRNKMLSKIEQHTFSDDQLSVNTLNPSLGCELSMYMPRVFYKGSDDEIEFFIDKDDAIALCEHFELLPKERHDQQVDSADSYNESLNNIKQELCEEAMKKVTIGYQEEKPYTPQVGEECEYETTFFSLDKSNSGKCKIIAYHNDRVWIDMADGGEAVINMKVIEFRPLKTERDKLLEQAVSNFSESELAIEENIKATCYRLIDAGWRPTNDY